MIERESSYSVACGYFGMVSHTVCPAWQESGPQYSGGAFFTSLGGEGALEYELKHKAIIDRFGRYPHRKEVIGWESTEEEIEFLKQPDSSF